MFDEIMIFGGLFWSITYILIIRRGFLDKTFGMPFAALCANISWEAIFAFVHPHSAPQIFINYAWFALDGVIVFQFFRYGKSELKLSSVTFYLVFVLGIVTAISMILAVNAEFDDDIGVYAAFGQNLMMSVLFVWMLYSRGDLRGQSIYVGLFKMLGTGLSSLAFYLYKPIAADSVLLHFLFVAIFVFDAIYFGLLIYKSRKLGLSLRRF